jgi:hypothetical protein
LFLHILIFSSHLIVRCAMQSTVMKSSFPFTDAIYFFSKIL